MNILKRAFRRGTRRFTVPMILLGILVATPSVLGVLSEAIEEPGSLSHVLENHKCKPWNGAFPSAVILERVPSGGYYYTRNTEKISKALGEKIDGQVWASHDAVRFCR